MTGAVALAVAGCSSSNQPSADTSPEIPPNPSASGSANTGGGSGNPSGPTDQPVNAPVALDKPAAFGNGVTAKVVKSQRVTLSAQGPGEVAGPGVRVELELTNGTGEAIDLNAVAANLFYGKDKTPASPALNSDTPFSGSLEAGKAAKAIYNFSLPKGADPVELQVSYTITQPVVVFVGKV